MAMGILATETQSLVFYFIRDEDINTDNASAPTPVPIAGPLTRARARKINHQVLILMQDWCTVCVERTIGSENVLDAPDGTRR